MVPLSAVSTSAVCGAFLRRLSWVLASAGFDGLNFCVDGDHRVAKAVEFSLRFAFGRSTIIVPGTGQEIVGA